MFSLNPTPCNDPTSPMNRMQLNLFFSGKPFPHPFLQHLCWQLRPKCSELCTKEKRMRPASEDCTSDGRKSKVGQIQSQHQYVETAVASCCLGLKKSNQPAHQPLQLSHQTDGERRPLHVHKQRGSATWPLQQLVVCRIFLAVFKQEARHLLTHTNIFS